jgi:phosphoesterase RecJ-like protein
MKSLKTLVRTIANSKRIAIATHRDPDGDGIAAALACAFLVKHFKRRKPVLFCHSRIPLKYQFLLGDWQFTRHVPDFDLLIAVDSAGVSRIFPKIAEQDLKGKAIINIDHHQSNNSFGTLRIVEETASSACEIIYFMFKKLKINISKPLADIFYCGIYNETGGFVYPNTTRICSREVAPKCPILRISSHFSRQWRGSGFPCSFGKKGTVHASACAATVSSMLINLPVSMVAEGIG